ncbi:peptide deformylase [Paracoccus gahaiensis]|uniref:peptide deformylase n=1 Tax=Paracoccus gahaiensis TaxID=1706839 RepID=UPI001FE70363|nr:peptide deformylase [Paracoccus gahaiensis]
MPDRADAPGWVRPVLTGDLASGTVHDLVLWPDPRLRMRCEPAGYLSSPELRQLAADLLATMYAAGGRGLAAPQIGVSRRIFVMDAGWKEGAPDPLVMTDPEILVRSPVTEAAIEGCLSIPDRPVEVVRPVSIGIAWYDLDGLYQLEQLDGAAARIAQHEADHLDGRLIVND